MFAVAAVTVLGAYLLGSINFAVIFTKIFLHEDVRDYGSGNAGTTNVMRVGGMLPGTLTFLGDVLKGFAASMAGKMVFQYLSGQIDASWANPVYGAYLCGLACILGHIFPVFFQFKGGKGVAISVGIFGVCCPKAMMLALGTFFIIVLISRIVSLSSICAVVVLVATNMIFYTRSALFWPQAVICVIMAIIIILKHSENIRRLIAGNEKRLQIRKKQG